MSNRDQGIGPRRGRAVLHTLPPQLVTDDNPAWETGLAARLAAANQIERDIMDLITGRRVPTDGELADVRALVQITHRAERRFVARYGYSANALSLSDMRALTPLIVRVAGLPFPAWTRGGARNASRDIAEYEASAKRRKNY